MKVDVIPISDKPSILGLLSQGGLYTGTGSHLRAPSKRTNKAVVLYPTVGLTDDPGDTYIYVGMRIPGQPGATSRRQQLSVTEY